MKVTELKTWQGKDLIIMAEADGPFYAAANIWPYRSCCTWRYRARRNNRKILEY